MGRDNGKYQQQEMARKQKEQELQAAYQERLSKYQQRVKALKVPGYQEAEQAVLEEIPIETQTRSCLSQRSRKSLFWRLVATLNCASNWQKLPTRSNWSSAGTYRIEGQNHAKSKNHAATTPTVKGSNGAVINNLDKLKAKALETGDWTPYFAAKKAKK